MRTRLRSALILLLLAYPAVALYNVGFSLWLAWARPWPEAVPAGAAGFVAMASGAVLQFLMAMFCIHFARAADAYFSAKRGFRGRLHRAEAFLAQYTALYLGVWAWSLASHGGEGAPPAGWVSALLEAASRLAVDAPLLASAFMMLALLREAAALKSEAERTV